MTSSSLIFPPLKFAGPHLEDSTEGYLICGQEHVHWGLAGAAGLLLVHRDEIGYSFFLQHRSTEVHEGDCWSTPGGALEHNETTAEGAVRETEEELGPLPDDLEKLGECVVDHDGWSYTTVVMSAPTLWSPLTLDVGWESGIQGARWFRLEDLPAIELHEGFLGSLLDLVSLLPA